MAEIHKEIGLDVGLRGVGPGDGSVSSNSEKFGDGRVQELESAGNY